MTDLTEISELAHCNQCFRQTNHRVKLLHDAVVTVDDYFINLNDKVEGRCADVCSRYDMLECLGCGDISIRFRTWQSPELESYEITDWDLLQSADGEETFFPSRVSRQIPRWVRLLDDKILTSLLREVYAALHSDSRQLATMGVRAILDDVMNKRGICKGGFKDRLEKMREDGWITIQDRDVLDAVVDAGNAAAHRGHTPPERSMSQAMDIMEALIHRLEIQPKTASQIKRDTPSRF